MNADELLRHYERVADASDAVTRLRRFVLELAVRGKLVDQSPADEPASELRRRISSEKARLSAAGLIRPPKPVPPLQDVPFELPDNWCWTQLAEIGLISPRNDAPDETMASFVPMTLVAADYGAKHGHEIRPWGEIKKGYTHFANEDVGLAKITPCFENGKSTVFRGLSNGIGSGTTELHIARPVLVSPDFIVLVLKSPYFIETGIPRMTGTAGQKRVPAEYFANSPFPLPPLAEQHRIVAKVDELMALCDRLEAARADREVARDRLTAASLARLNTPDPETFTDDARFALRALPEISARPQLVDQLRQTILTLAVRGKLNASLSSSNSSMERSSSGAPAEPLPAHWKWARAEEICEAIVDCPHSTPAFVPSGVVCLDTNAFKGGRIIPSKVRYVTEESYRDRVKRLAPQPGDIVFAREGSVGESVIVPDGMLCCLGQRVMLFRPSELVDSRYFQLAISEPGSLTRLLALHKGIGAKHVNVADMRKAQIPLPPLDEQHAIVGKVAELTAICARLASNLAQVEDVRRRLLEALLRDALELRQAEEEVA
jgi:type I restriction enzyme S subunit